jgi:hypothetical protein
MREDNIKMNLKEIRRENLTGFISPRVGILRTKNVHEDESFLGSRQSLSYSRISKHFIEPEGSLPYSQELSTGLYTQPDESSPYHSILFLSDPF